MDWLAPHIHEDLHLDAIEKQQRGTGQWFLDSPEFSAWVRGDSQTLFCPGIPGAGKTILASVAIQHLRSALAYEGSSVAFLYCNYRRQKEQTAKRLLRTLLKQLTKEDGSIPEAIKTLHVTHTKQQTQPSTEEILASLSTAITRRHRVFLVIDAIDECSSNVRREFLKSIRELQNQAKVSLLATSRHIEDIDEHFAGCPHLEIRADPTDVEKHLDDHLGNLSTCVQEDNTLWRKVKKCIIDAANGM